MSIQDHSTDDPAELLTTYEMRKALVSKAQRHDVCARSFRESGLADGDAEHLRIARNQRQDAFEARRAAREL